MVPLTPKVCEHVDEIVLFWFLEGSSFDPVYLVVPVGRSSEVDLTGLGLLNT